MAMRQQQAEQFSSAFHKTDIRRDDINARVIVTGKGDSQIDHNPLPLPRPITVEIAVHTNLASAASGKKPVLYRPLFIQSHSGKNTSRINCLISPDSVAKQCPLSSISLKIPSNSHFPVLRQSAPQTMRNSAPSLQNRPETAIAPLPKHLIKGRRISSAKLWRRIHMGGRRWWPDMAYHQGDGPD